MKKILLILLSVFALSLTYAQRTVGIFTIPNDTTEFGVVKAAGTVVLNEQNNILYQLDEKAETTSILNTLSKSENVTVDALSGYLNSMSDDKPDLTIVVDGTSVFLDVENIDGGDMDFYIDGEKLTLDCTSGSGVDGKARVELAQGTSSLDKWTSTYVAWSEQNNALVLHNSEQLPLNAYSNIAYISIQDYSTVSSSGAIVFQRTTEAISFSGQSSISRMRENTRLVKGGGWWNGMSPELEIVTNSGAIDSIKLKITAGTAYQMNRQKFGAYDITTDGIWLSQLDNTGSLSNLQRLTNLGELTETSEGTALTDGDIIIWDVYANVNYSTDACKVFVIPNNHVYTDEASAKQFARGSRNLTIPKNSRSVGMHICRLVMKYNTANNGTWSNVLSDAQLVWRTGYQTITTPNYPSNYGNNYDGYLGTITQTGALQIKAYFDAFNTEANYDYVYLRDGSSSTNRYTYHGNLGSFISGAVSGNTMRVYFHSDGSVTRSGSRILSYQYQVSIATGGEYINLRE